MQMPTPVPHISSHVLALIDEAKSSTD